MSNGQAPRDDNNTPALIGWDPVGHQVAAVQVATVSTDSVTGAKYAQLASSTNNTVGTIGSAIPSTATLIGVKDGSGNVQTLKVDGAQNLYVAPISLATPLEVSATGAAAASVTATLPAVAFATTLISGFVVTASPSTAVVTGVVTVTGLTNTMSFQFVENTTQGGFLAVNFPYSLGASAVNTAIVVTVPAITNGGAVSIVAYGWR